MEGSSGKIDGAGLNSGEKIAEREIPDSLLSPSARFGDPYKTEPVPDWLTVALAQIDRQQVNNASDRARAALARLIVQSIEAEHINAPYVFRSDSGWIHIIFQYGQRSLEFHVSHPKAYHVIRHSPYESSPRTFHSGWPGNVAREAIRWLYATCHIMTTKDGEWARVLEEGI